RGRAVAGSRPRPGVLGDQLAVSVGGGGTGQVRGGRGLARDDRIIADEAQLTATFGRFKFPPWSVAGGHPGAPNFVKVLHQGGREVVFGKCARYRLRKGDVARLVTGSGGGWGDPARRDRALIQRDLREE